MLSLPSLSCFLTKTHILKDFGFHLSFKIDETLSLESSVQNEPMRAEFDWIELPR